MAKAKRHFRPALFEFLRDLAANNDREWFEENKERYERDVREPGLQFIRDFEPRLEKISPHFVADPRKSGGSLFRIHRDIRFSRDKSPYKTWTGIQFRHEAARTVHTPGFYLHLEPRQVFVGVGCWHPTSEAIRKIRASILEDPDSWKAAFEDEDLRERFEPAGDSLRRAPRGFDPDHPMIDDLKRKDYIAVAELTQKAATARGFIDEFEGLCKQGTPLVRWLCRAIEVPF